MTSEKIGKIGITTWRKLKTSARRYYITVPKKVVDVYDLLPGDMLKISIREALRKPREGEA